MQRVEKILSSASYLDYLARNEEKETERIFCCHGYQHLLDTARITYILILENQESYSREIVYAAALLHDIGRWQQYETGEDHALVSARLARAILREADFSPEEENLICQAIAEHRSSCEPQSVLGIYLKKADKLSRLCSRCSAQAECKKFEAMPTAHKKLIY